MEKSDIANIDTKILILMSHGMPPDINFFFFNKKTKETARPIQSIWVLLRETCDAYCLQSEPNFNSIQNDNPKLQNEKCRTLNQFLNFFFFLMNKKN